MKRITNAKQFELLVAFMEEHGDLNKPAANVKGREYCNMLWKKLVKLLNSEGETKSLDKWKKVWSDLKNYAKRKASRIERAQRSTLGVPCDITITELEQRVLYLGGIKTMTEFVRVLVPDPPEQTPTVSSSPQMISPEPPKDLPPVLEDSLPAESSYTFTLVEPNSSDDCGTRDLPPVLEDSLPAESPCTFTLLEPNSPDDCGTTEECEQPRPSSANGETHPLKLTDMSSQRRISRKKRLPKRLKDTMSADVRRYLRSESRWRKFKMEQHNAQIELEREKNRIRELDVRTQKEWIGLGHRFVNVLWQFVNKFER